MRRGIAAAALLMMACAHKPPPAPPPPPPPPPPKGEVLRFKAKPGDETRSRVKLTVEVEQAAAQGDKRGTSKPVTLSFSFGEEEKVDSVAQDGSMIISSRLVDAVGQGSAGTSQQTLDVFEDRWRRAAADLDNLRKRYAREVAGERENER